MIDTSMTIHLGYSVFAVVQKDPEGPLALPRTEADEFATAIPEGAASSRTRGVHSSSRPTIEGFEDEDMELQAALQASLMGGASWEQHDAPYPAPVAAAARDPIFGSGTQTPVDRAQAGAQTSYAMPGTLDEDEDLDDVDIEELAPPPVNRFAQLGADSADPLAASRARSQAYMEHVRRQQEAALRDSYQEEAARMEAGVGRRNARAEQEEAELMRVIEASRAMHEAMGSVAASGNDERDESRPNPPASALGRDRVYDDEDAELQAALKASLEALPEGFQVPSTPPPARPPSLPATSAAPSTNNHPQLQQREADEEEDIETESEADVAAAEPEPPLSMEEIRKKRLARFGA